MQTVLEISNRRPTGAIPSPSWPKAHAFFFTLLFFIILLFLLFFWWEINIAIYVLYFPSTCHTGYIDYFFHPYNCDLILHFIFWFLKRWKKSLEAKPQGGRRPTIGTCSQGPMELGTGAAVCSWSPSNVVHPRYSSSTKAATFSLSINVWSGWWLHDLFLCNHLNSIWNSLY